MIREALDCCKNEPNAYKSPDADLIYLNPAHTHSKAITMDEILSYLPLLAPLLIIEIVLLVVALVDLIRREQVRYFPKWVWVVIILILNFIGPIAYLLLGREET